MEMRFTEVQELPPLSWCAAHQRTNRHVEVFHGSGVEVRTEAFVEGAWDGPFHEFGFDEAFLAGSGGKVRGDVVVFVAPSHPFERLVRYERDDVTLLSNSMPFALAFAQDELDPSFVHYRNFFQSALRDPFKGRRTVPTKGSGQLVLHYRETVILGPEGVREVVLPERTPNFHTFDEYRSFLVNRVAAIFSNAAEPTRLTRYSPLASVSSGYDSGACAAISREAGCTDAITLRRQRVDGSFLDHGGEVAAALNLRLHEADRGAYFASDEQVEPVFLAAGFGAEDLTLAGFQPFVGARVLVTGAHGDRVWTLNRSIVSDGVIRRPDAAAASLGEFRLRENFVHLPVALLGATAGLSIWEISTSEEMKPWSVGGKYDRPIPRRILEEAGVPRGTFAKRKLGYVGKLQVELEKGYTISSLIPLSPKSQKLFQLYCKEHLRARHRFAEWRARPLRALDRRVRARERDSGLGPALVRFASRALMGAPPSHVLNVKYGEESLLPLWGVGIISKQYEAALHGNRTSDTVPSPASSPDRIRV